MKRKLLALVLASALIMMIVTGCGNNENQPATPIQAPEQTPAETPPNEPETLSEPETVTEPVDPPAVEDGIVYRELLDSFYDLLSGGFEQHDIDLIPGSTGIVEATQAMEKEDALDSVGYVVLDISGDEIPELLIGAVSKNGTFSPYNDFLYAGFTASQEKPLVIFEGTARSSFRYLGGGDFLYRGSSGAMYSAFGTYSLSTDGTSLSANDYYFTYEKGESGEEIGYYHNTTGDWEPAVSEELHLTREEFWQKQYDLEEKIQYLELIPFSEYKQTDDETNSVTSLPVHAHWAEDILAQYGDYEEFTLDETEPTSRVALTTDRAVHGLKVLALTLEDVDEDGTIHFSTEARLDNYSLLPDSPLVLVMTFYGSTPSYGISYVDDSGTTRYFAFTVSGEDGSIRLDEFFIE